MEKRSRREFIKATGSILLAASGVTIFGTFKGAARPGNFSEESDLNYYADGYYGDGYSAINEITDLKISLVVFPNPSNGNFSLSLNSERPIHADIFIQDLSGKTLVVRSHFLTEGANQVNFEALDLAQGTYILSVVTSKTTDSLPIIIAK